MAMVFIPSKVATPNQFDEPQEADRHPLLLAYVHACWKGAAKIDKDDPCAVYIKNWLCWHILKCKANDACNDWNIQVGLQVALACVTVI